MLYCTGQSQKNKVSEFARLTQIPVMLISYEMLMRNFDDISKVKFDILVCDEGHRLKNNNIRTSVVSSCSLFLLVFFWYYLKN